MGLDHLKNLAQDLRDGIDIPQITVRNLLLLFHAERPDYCVVQEIRAALNEARLATDPDFEFASIDSKITLSLVQEQTFLPCYADPTYRIGELAASKKELFSVSPNSTLQEAITLMLSNNFSQLPVMTGKRGVKGVVSWKSIGTRLSLGKYGTHVREFMDEHQEISADKPLLDAVLKIADHEYALIRGNDKSITGIVTASDLSLQFKKLAEPFLLLREIENHIRRIIVNKFSVEELASARDPHGIDRKVNGVADLTLGEYIQLLEKPEYWGKLNLPVDRKIFIRSLDHARAIRNAVMHFDPNGIADEDLNHLKCFVQFLRELQCIGVT